MLPANWLVVVFFLHIINCIKSWWWYQGIDDWTGTETLAKEPRLAKSLRELKSTPVRYYKKVLWFFSHVCNRNLLGFGCFAVGQHFYGCFLFMRCNIHNWLVNVCILKIYMFYFGKDVTVFGFLRFLSPYFFACVATDQSLSMTGAVDTY